MTNQIETLCFTKFLSKPFPHWILATETAMMQIYHTVYENTKRKLISFAYFNKTYNNPKPLDIGTIVLERNFLHVYFSYKLKPLRIGAFKINKKSSDITYEIVNQDGFTSHVHRNHLVPYHPKEPIIFPFLQQYNPCSIKDNHNDSDINGPIQFFDSLSDDEQEQSIDDEQFTYSDSNKETDVPSTIDFQPESFSQYSSFPYQKINKKLIIPTRKTKLIFMTTIILLTPEDTPLTDTISAHNHEKTIDLSSVKMI